MYATPRFDAAIKKLYIAYHSNKLNPECCEQCAVGNILDNKDGWKNLSDNHGSLKLNYVGLVNQKFGKRFNGYTPLELLKIEATFLKACGFELPLSYNHIKPKNPTDKDILFDGLCAVIKLLCQMEGINNIMEYTEIFKYKPDRIAYF